MNSYGYLDDFGHTNFLFLYKIIKPMNVMLIIMIMIKTIRIMKISIIKIMNYFFLFKIF